MAVQDIQFPIKGSDLQNLLNSNFQEFLSDVKKFGDKGQIKFTQDNLHFYLQIFENGSWKTKAEIGKSIIVDALRLIKGDKPTNILPGEIAIYNKEITLPDGSKSIRPHFVLEDGTEYGFIVHDEQLDAVVYRKDDGELRHIPVIYFNKNNDSFIDISGIKFSGDVSLTKDNSSKILTVDISGSGLEDEEEKLLHKIIDKPTLPDIKLQNFQVTKANSELLNFRTVSLNFSGSGVQNVNLDPIATFDNDHRFIFIFTNKRSDNGVAQINPSNGEKIGGNFSFDLPVDDTVVIERPGDGVTDWNVLARFRKDYGGALTPENIVQAINQYLGKTCWQNCGGGTHPGNTFIAYSGFYHGDTIPESAIKLLKKETLQNPVHNFYGTQKTPPNYFYIVMPKVDADHVGYIAQAPSALGSEWVVSYITMDNVDFTIFRSPNRMYDAGPTFKMLPK